MVKFASIGGRKSLRKIRQEASAFCIESYFMREMVGSVAQHNSDWPCDFFNIEYTITMYDTKSKELRWNATYFDYAATLPDEDVQYSKNFGPN